jgi:NADPH:quinone reductase-like Zn-dependent oxidoreductase
LNKENKMRIVQYHTYGDPEQVLRVNRMAAPSAPGPGQLLVRVLARPVHPGDLLGIEGRYSGAATGAPVAAGAASPGFEGMGVIEAVGEGVDEAALAPGMRVAFFPAGGAWGELALVPAQFATPLPDTVSDAAGAQLHVNPLTARMLLRAALEAGAGNKGAMVLTAAGSGVAKLLAALALDAGLPVIGLVRSSAGAAELAAVHPRLPVIATDRPDWRAALERTLEGKPLRVVVDAVGGALPSELFQRLAAGGTLVMYGDLTGEPLSIPALLFSVRDLHIEGVSVGRWAGLPAAQRHEDLQEVLGLVLRHPQLFDVAASYDLDEVGTAVAHSRRARKGGAVILRSPAPHGPLRQRRKHRVVRV